MILAEDRRVQLAASVIRTMADWSISPKQQLALLNIDVNVRELTKFTNGKPLPDEEDVLDRTKHILGIAKALRSFFPLNHKGGAIWLRNKNKYFLERAPMQVMLEDGISGMHKVWTNLDCSQGWDD